MGWLGAVQAQEFGVAKWPRTGAADALRSAHPGKRAPRARSRFPGMSLLPHKAQ